MRWLLAFSFAIPALAQQPSDAAIAAYFKADSAVVTARGNHDALLEQIKKALSDSVANQVNANLMAQQALSNLQAACAAKTHIDLDLLKKTGDVKCTPVVEAPATTPKP